MNKHPGTLGYKLGMTQYFEAGALERATVIECTAVVVGKRTIEKDTYSALIVGLGERKEKHLNKAQIVAFKKAGVAPVHIIKELRLPAELVAEYELGQKIALDKVFEVGQLVDVQGVTRGRGFSGVMRRHQFKGAATNTHGTHEYKRHGGSIGTNMTPGRTLPGMRMPGQHGNFQVTTLNVKVVKILADQNLIFIRGSVPGPRNQVVVVRGAVKKSGGKPKPVTVATTKTAAKTPTKTK